ncbi:MAG TPA: class I adenylate cyclase [Deltaproteobacteria bacterium]|nr:class I adenylate cyclase [Deltaproteobacteria bacterium]
MGKTDSSIENGHRAFTLYNRYKRDTMYKCDPVGTRVVLEFLPLLLHINHPALPGYQEQEDCPCGIKLMDWPATAIKEVGSFFSSRIKLGDMRDYIPREHEIEGLFTIGSVGSLAQTRDSDYDIWVVVDARNMDPARFKALSRKLRYLKRWISSKFVLDIHFFLMDLQDIRMNNFGSVSQEGSGTALKSILKEEFYRTMTLIEGRVPLWWIVPPDRGAQGYEQMRSLLQKDSTSGSQRFIDMGDLEGIPEEELLGAALWQMHKALDDPLKSVLKMALVASYLEASSQDMLLCNMLKKTVLDAARGQIVDPYFQVLRRVEDYYGNKGDERAVDLLRKCFYLKVSPNIRASDLVKIERNDKASIMVDIVREWGWSLHTLSQLNRFAEWGVDRYRRFGDDIHSFLKLTTVQLIRRAKAYMVSSSVADDVEVEVLRRRIEAFYVSKDGKIESEKRVKRKEPAYRDLYFAFAHDRWSIYERTPEPGRSEPVMSSERVARILAWLVYNKRFDASTAFHMIPNVSQVSLSDIQSLLWKLNAVIPDAASVGLDRSSLMEDKYAKNLVIIGNMESPGTQHSIREVDIVFLNTWNELFCLALKPEQLKSWTARMKRPHTEVTIWLPREGNTNFLTQALLALIG